MKRSWPFFLGTLLAGCRSDHSAAATEVGRREAMRRDLLVDAGARRALEMSSSNDVLFQEGFGVLGFDPPDDMRGTAFRWINQNAHARLRVKDPTRAMKLEVWGWVNAKVVRTKVVVSLYVNGQLIANTPPIPEEGGYGLWGRVTPEMMRGKQWLDLVVTVSAVAFHWADVPGLRVAHVNHLDWTEDK